MLKKVYEHLTNKSEKQRLKEQRKRVQDRSFTVETPKAKYVTNLGKGWGPIPAILKGHGQMRIFREVGNLLILEFKTKEGFYMDLHTHIKEGYEFEILYTNTGRVIMEVDDMELHVGEGQLEVIDAQYPHAARVRAKSRGYIVYTKHRSNEQKK